MTEKRSPKILMIVLIVNKQVKKRQVETLAHNLSVIT